jgi:hypothetical protein
MVPDLTLILSILILFWLERSFFENSWRQASEIRQMDGRTLTQTDHKLGTDFKIREEAL